MHFFKTLLMAALLTGLSTGAFAQDVYTSSGKPVNRTRSNNAKTGFDPDRMIYGGGITLGFGSGGGGSVFQIGASPIVGYRLTNNFMAGVGLGYQYLSFKNYYQSPNGTLYPLHQHLISPSVWARYGLFESFFLHGEYEHNFVTYNRLGWDASGQVVNSRVNLSAPALLVGGGFRQPLSDRSSLLIAVLYDVLQDKNSPYGRGIILRTGISIGY